jgi:glycine cleavage system H protein
MPWAVARRALSTVRRSPCGSVWISRQSHGVYHLGVDAERAGVGAIGFVDLVVDGSVLLPGRPFAMVEGPEGQKTLASPISGTVGALNAALVDAPALCDIALCDGAEDLAAAWIVEVDSALDDDDAEEEFDALPI